MYNKAANQLQAELDEQIAEANEYSSSCCYSRHQTIPVFGSVSRMRKCRKVQEVNAEGKAAGLEKEIRAGMERWLEEQLQCIQVQVEQSAKTEEMRGECLQILQGHSSYVRCLQVLPEGQTAGQEFLDQAICININECELKDFHFKEILSY